MPQTRDFLTTEKLGRTRELTPEGYLLCREVPIARTGTLLYGETEGLPVDAKNGEIHIERGEAELFDADTVASFEGKPVTLDHPDEWVSPDNFKQLSVGHVQNVRQGTGAQDQYLMADLMVTDREAINSITRDGVREVSCGYDADYEQTEVGRGRQTNIKANHVAVVKYGRCGSTCGIGDSAMPQRKKSWFGNLFAARKTMDEAIEEAKAAGATDEDIEAVTKDDDTAPPDDNTAKETKDALLTISKTMDKMSRALDKVLKTRDAEAEQSKPEEEAKTEDGEGDLTDPVPAQKIDDEGVMTADSLAGILVKAEILAPAMGLPTRDSQGSNGSFAKIIMIKALNTAYATKDGKAAIAPFLDGQGATFASMPFKQLIGVFNGSAALMRERNNQGATRDGYATHAAPAHTNRNAAINQRNRDFYKR